MESLGPASVAIGTATSVFLGFLPSFSEVRRADPDDEGMARDIKLGLVAACSVTLGTGTVVSFLTSSSLPLLVSALMSALLVWCYTNARKDV